MTVFGNRFEKKRKEKKEEKKTFTFVRFFHLLPDLDLPDLGFWRSLTQNIFLGVSKSAGEVKAVGKIGHDPYLASPEVSKPSLLQHIVFAAVAQCERAGCM